MLKQGIELLVKEKLLTDTPMSLAHFLFTTPQLNQELVGDFISEPYVPTILVARLKLDTLVVDITYIYIYSR